MHTEYLEKTVFPFQNVRKVMNLREDQKVLLIYDVFKGQTTSAVTKSLHCLSKKVPENHSNLFQPLDLTVNTPAKSFISNKYQDWYADRVSEQLNRCSPRCEVVDGETAACPMGSRFLQKYAACFIEKHHKESV